MTTHTTTSLTAFLLARYDDAEAEVQHWPSDGPWGLHPSGRMWTDTHGHPVYAPRDRVLAEVKAHRAIVAEHWTETGTLNEDHAGDCFTCMEPAPCLTMRHLGAIHAAHPNYDESWRP